MKIAVLTSGGDSAGMNAVVRAVVKAGILKYVLLPPFFFRGGLVLKEHTHQQRM
jgi:6-phosphofructokinase